MFIEIGTKVFVSLRRSAMFIGKSTRFRASSVGAKRQPMKKPGKNNISLRRSGRFPYSRRPKNISSFRDCIPSGRLIALAFVALFIALAIFDTHRTVHASNEAGRNENAADERSALIDQALFTRAEFFGAQALVPYPTGEARERLAAVQARYPADPEIDLKLSQFDEKLGRDEAALKEMRAFVEHEPDKVKGLDALAAFAARRAHFAAQAEALEKMLQVAPAEARPQIFRQLTELAQTHLLERYLAPAFYEQTLAQN